MAWEDVTSSSLIMGDNHPLRRVSSAQGASDTSQTVWSPPGRGETGITVAIVRWSWQTWGTACCISLILQGYGIAATASSRHQSRYMIKWPFAKWPFFPLCTWKIFFNVPRTRASEFTLKNRRLFWTMNHNLFCLCPLHCGLRDRN